MLKSSTDVLAESVESKPIKQEVNRSSDTSPYKVSTDVLVESVESKPAKQKVNRSSDPSPYKVSFPVFKELLFVYFISFSNIISTEKTTGFGRIQTPTVRVEGKRTEH